MAADRSIASFARLLGTWTTEATHPSMPGVVVHGTAVIEWLEGEKFLVIRARTDHPLFPDSLSVIGDMSRDRADGASVARAAIEAAPSAFAMHYFDSRGVFRVYETRVGDASWDYWRDAPGFSQRFSGEFADGGRTIVGRTKLCEDDVHWADDLAITYRRA